MLSFGTVDSWSSYCFLDLSIYFMLIVGLMGLKVSDWLTDW